MILIIERLTLNFSDWKFLFMFIFGIINFCNVLGIFMVDFIVKLGVRIFFD